MCVREHVIIYCQSYCGSVIKDIYNTVNCDEKRLKNTCSLGEKQNANPILGAFCSLCHSQRQKELKKDLDSRFQHFTRPLGERRELAKDCEKRWQESKERGDLVPRQRLIGASPRRQEIDVAPRLTESPKLVVHSPYSSRQGLRPNRVTWSGRRGLGGTGEGVLGMSIDSDDMGTGKWKERGSMSMSKSTSKAMGSSNVWMGRKRMSGATGRNRIDMGGAVARGSTDKGVRGLGMQRDGSDENGHRISSSRDLIFASKAAPPTSGLVVEAAPEKTNGQPQATGGVSEQVVD